MEYANSKDEIFKIRYNHQSGIIEETSKGNVRLINLIKRHKIVSILVGTTIVAISIDLLLIYSFFKILVLM